MKVHRGHMTQYGAITMTDCFVWMYQAILLSLLQKYKSNHRHDSNSYDVDVFAEVWVGTCDDMLNLLQKNHH